MALQNICAPLRAKSTFEDYIRVINSTLGFELQNIEACKLEICREIYGTGNSDIAGPGVTIGYFLSNALAATIILSWLVASLVKQSPKDTASTWLLLLKSFSAAFFDAALFLCFAVQVACNVILGLAEAGSQPVGMGSSNLDLAWTASLLTLFPLMLCFVPQICSSVDDMSTSEARQQSANLRRAILRVQLFVLCWILSVYPFLNRVLQTFPSNAIGSDPGDVVSTYDFAPIADMCTGAIKQLTQKEDEIMDAFGIGGWLFLSLFVVYLCLDYLSEFLPSKLRAQIFPSRKSLFPTPAYSSKAPRSGIISLCLLVTAVLSIGNMWAFCRIKQLQRDLSRNIGDEYGDDTWSFGQVAAIAAFASIIPQVWYAIQMLPEDKRRDLFSTVCFWQIESHSSRTYATTRHDKGLVDRARGGHGMDHLHR